MYLNDHSTCARHLKELRKKGDLEDLCAQCGVCCFLSVPMRDGEMVQKVLIPKLPCKFLQREGQGKRICTIYPERHQHAHWCVDLLEGMRHGTFPVFCPYVKDLPGYKGSVLLPEAVFNRILPFIQIEVKNSGRIDAISESDQKHFLEE